jgi:hypothetical protein
LSDKLERQRQDCEPLAEKWSLNRLKLSRSDDPVIRLRTTLMRSRLLLSRLAEGVLLHDGSGFAPRGIDGLVTEGSNCHTVIHGLHLNDVPLLLNLALPFFCYKIFEPGLTLVCEVTTSITNAATAPKGFASYFLSPTVARCTLSLDMHERRVLAPMET